MWSTESESERGAKRVTCGTYSPHHHGDRAVKVKDTKTTNDLHFQSPLSTRMRLYLRFLQ